MSKLNNSKVDYARAHGPVFVPDLGQFGPELNINTPGGRIKDMEIDEPFLVVTVENNKKQLVTLPVPLANISHMRQLVEKNSK